jgi:predicted RNase H-like nuclease (RuvC/YqgF family)
MTAKAYLGIDPGITGAIALIHDDGQIVEAMNR